MKTGVNFNWPTMYKTRCCSRCIRVELYFMALAASLINTVFKGTQYA